MNSDLIDHLLSKDKITRKKFRGVFSRDNIPTPKHAENFYVVNLDTSYQDGSHWVAMYISENNTCEYYDSFGIKPQHNEIKYHLGPDYIYNEMQIQHPFSSVCGQHVIFYIIQRCNGLSLKQIQQIFEYTSSPKKYLLHDIIVNTAVERYFNVNLSVFDFEYLSQELGAIDLKQLPIDDNGKLLLSKWK